MYYEARVKNTPDEHGQRPADGDIVTVFTCIVGVDHNRDIIRWYETCDAPTSDDVPVWDDTITNDVWIGVYVRYRDGRALAVLDLILPRDEDGDPMYQHLYQTMPPDAVALVDLLADLPLGMLDRFVCQALDLPTTG